LQFEAEALPASQMEPGGDLPNRQRFFPAQPRGHGQSGRAPVHPLTEIAPTPPSVPWPANSP
jgi:hypothetical protein